MQDQIDNNTPFLLLNTVQWSRIQQIEDMEPIGDSDYKVLEEIRQVILRHGYQDRFGICLLHKHFDMQPGEAALEESDEKTRISTIRIVPESVTQDAMETAWSFATDTDLRAGRRCRGYCQGFGQTGHSRKHECIGS